MNIITIIVSPDSLEDHIKSFNVHIGRIDEIVQFVEFIPNLFFEDSFRGDHKAIIADEVSLALITEVRVALQELSKFISLGDKFIVLIGEHADCSSSVDDQHLLSHREYFSVVLVDSS